MTRTGTGGAAERFWVGARGAGRHRNRLTGRLTCATIGLTEGGAARALRFGRATDAANAVTLKPQHTLRLVNLIRVMPAEGTVVQMRNPPCI